MRGLTIAVFLLCLVSILMIEVAGRLRPDRFRPMGPIFGVVMQRRSTRVAIVVFWWWMGWHFLVEP